MSNTIALDTDVVKKYHILLNNKAGYANVVCVGFLHLLEIFFRAFERKFRRMVERLPIQPFRIVKAQPCRLYNKIGHFLPYFDRFPLSVAVKENSGIEVTKLAKGVLLILSYFPATHSTKEEPGKSQLKPRCSWLLPGSNWGFVQGGFPLYVY